ncbi:RluA family pseudouridine synthase [Tumebacillus sp. DT12]|uniref:Pseudouridine synthase n=1 Tax=Tumebacillus lacus TaxID=2995335 RepID=A0ABT3X6Y0_9BACL|nr:RluA family pseudouridine synthase [Tumebacillus lacus]MCX7571360.1 RluA family pseudouridine synthase [Tumebacillus lacus]
MHQEKSGPWLEARITREQAGRTMLELLVEEIGLPDKAARELFRKGDVERGKETARPEDTVKAGELLRCLLFPEEPYGFEPVMWPLDVLYEDDHLIVINKEAGRKVHPNDPDETDTLLNALAFHYQMQGLETKVRILHRLDQETSGAILFPKHAVAQTVLDAMLAERTVSREYRALVQGKVVQKKGLIDAPIGRDRYHATRRRVSQTGKAAQTEYEVVTRYRNATLVKARLRTGRTHQIRVHFAHLGHPLVGDELYGGSTVQFGRQALHAALLRFPHPLTGELLEIEAPMPDDLADLLQRLAPL